MKLSQVLSAGGVAWPGGDVEVTGLTADSRKVQPGFVFAALKGVAADGAKFVPQAVDAGAVAVLGDHDVPDTSVPVIRVDHPRKTLAHMSAAFTPRQPEVIAAITGTNGKSSCVEFVRQLWAFAGLNGACLGTLGVTRASGVVEDLGHTTPDPVAIHQCLDGVAGDGVSHLAMEASSHGLVQNRLDAVRLSAVGFTNLSQDHLDYHPTVEDYFAAKLRLFTELAPATGHAVVNVDDAFGVRVAQACRDRGLATDTVGWRGETIKLREVTPRATGQRLDLLIDGREHVLDLPLVGEFQALNAVLAAQMARVTGVAEDLVFAGLGQLSGVRGRLEFAGATGDGAGVFVDYAHTPDGIEKVLKALRPHTQGRLVIVLGCGGDRDPTKRGPMGEIAARLADHVIITDDNPRSEDPALIRAAVLAGAPGGVEIGDRGEAIGAGIGELGAGDALVIAGKGHEQGQIVGDHVIAFDDVDVARKALGLGGAEPR